MNALVTDQELVMTFSSARPEGTWRYQAIFYYTDTRGEIQYLHKYLSAKSLKDARWVSREYALRLLSKTRLVSVSRIAS